MRKITSMVWHCSDSSFGDAKTIDGWHKKRNPPFREIGYHYVILNGYRKPGQYDPSCNGLIEAGRSVDNDIFLTENEVGAHALGYNRDSLGVCLIGKPPGDAFSVAYPYTSTFFTLEQYWSGLLLGAVWSRLVPDLRHIGHNETEPSKLCPVFNMDKFRARVQLLLAGNLSYDGLKKILEKEGF